MEALLKALQELIIKIQAYLAQPEPPPIIMDDGIKNSHLNQFCLAIQRHEGYFANSTQGYPNGSRSFRNKNPGNLRYAQQAKAIGKDEDNFAIFATYQDGFNALKGMILNAAKGNSKIYKPEMNLLQFFAKYAPSFDDNDTVSYAKVVAAAIDVDAVTFKIKDFL